MDTIDGVLLIRIIPILDECGLTHIDTIKVELNGQHGGADLIIKGYDTNESMDVSLYNRKTIKVAIK